MPGSHHHSIHFPVTTYHFVFHAIVTCPYILTSLLVSGPPLQVLSQPAHRGHLRKCSCGHDTRLLRDPSPSDPCLFFWSYLLPSFSMLRAQPHSTGSLRFIKCTCCSLCLACTPQLAQVPHPTFLLFLLTHRLLTPLTIAAIKPSRETAFMCLNPTLDCKLPGGQDLRLLFYSFIKGTSYMDSTPYTLTAGIHEINTRLSHLYKQTSDQMALRDYIELMPSRLAIQLWAFSLPCYRAKSKTYLVVHIRRKVIKIEMAIKQRSKEEE